jgi:type IV fimbrial biogenesis protein FimT
MKKQHGFTVIELLIGIAVAAILLALAAPGFSSMMSGYRLTSATNDLVNVVGLARSEAIKRNRTIELCRVAAANSTACADAPGDWDNWIIVAPGADVIRRGEPGLTGSGLRITSGFTNARLRFAPDGTPSENAAFLVCVPPDISENRRSIDIGPGSRVSTSRDSGACS